VPSKCYNKTIIKLDWLKNKRTLLIAFAVVFVVSLFFIKIQSNFKNEGNQTALGIVYDSDKVVDLINKDSDGDGVTDWEEGLWGTNPLSIDSNEDGVPDGVEISKMKLARGNVTIGTGNGEPEGGLTETDTFSRELFSTIATLNQVGEVNQETIEKLSDSLVSQVKNPVVRKIFLISDIKIIEDNSAQAFKNYNNALDNIFEKSPITGSVMDILERFVNDEEEVDLGVLSELDPIITQTTKFLDGIANINVPKDLSQFHLSVLNGLERIIENLNDIKLFDVDPIIAMGAVSKYQENLDLLGNAITALTNVLTQKLNI